MVIECKKCKTETTNYTANDVNGWCRDCRTSYQKDRNMNRSALLRGKYKCPDICVYAFKMDDEIMYIGSSDITPFRLNEHYLGYRSFKERSNYNRLEFESNFTWHILWYGDSKEDAIHMEKINIKTFQPKFNKIKYKTYEG